MPIANLVVRISGDLTGLEKSVERAAGRIRRFGSDLSNIGSSLTIGLTAPLVGAAAAALKTAGDFDSLKRGLVAVTGSAAAAESQFTKLRDVAKLPGLGFKEAVQGAINLQAVGFSADKSREVLMKFGNALASVGRGREDLQEVIRQLGQMAARGKVTADNLKPILERVPQIATIIKQEFGTIDTEVIQKMGVSADEFINILLRGLGKLAPVTSGIKNEMENMKDSFQIALNEVGKGLIPFAMATMQAIEPVIKKIGEVGTAFQGAAPEVQRFTVIVSALAAASGPTLFVLGSMLTQLGSVAGAFGITKLAMLGWVAAIPIAIGAIATLALSFSDLREAQKSSAQSAETARLAVMRLSKHLIEQGVDAAWDLEGAYAHGKITLDQFRTELIKLAKAHGDTVKVTDKSTDSTHKSYAAVAAAKKAQEEYAEALKYSVSHAIPFGEKTKENAILMGEFNERVRQQKQLLEDIVKARLAPVKFEMEMEPLAAPNVDLTKVGLKLPLPTGPDDPYKRLGIPSPTDLKKTADAARAAFAEVVRLEGAKAAAGDVTAQTALQAAAEKAMKAEQALRGIKKVSHAESKAALKEISTIINDMDRGIAQAIIHWKGFGALAKSTLESIGESILRNIIRRILESTKVVDKLVGAIGSVLGHIPGLGGIFGKAAAPAVGATTTVLTGIGGTGIGAGAGAATTAATTTASTATSAVAGAASSLMGTVGAISAAVGAASSLVGNFQMMGMNKSLDLIEHEVRFSQIHLSHILNNALLWWPKLNDIHQRLIEFGTRGMGVFNAAGDQGLRLAGSVAGGGGINIENLNVYSTGDAREQAQALMRELKKLSPAFS